MDINFFIIWVVVCFDFSYLLYVYQNYLDKKNFFLVNCFIDKFVGSVQFRE